MTTVPLPIAPCPVNPACPACMVTPPVSALFRFVIAMTLPLIKTDWLLDKIAPTTAVWLETFMFGLPDEVASVRVLAPVR